MKKRNLLLLMSLLCSGFVVACDGELPISSSSINEVINAENIELKLDSTLKTKEENLIINDDSTRITKYVLLYDQSTKIETSILPDNAEEKDVEFFIEDGKEDVLDVAKDGTITAKNTSIERVLVTVAIKNTSIKKDLYFQIMSSSEFIDEFVFSLKNHTEEAEKTKAVHTTGKYTSIKNDGESTRTTEADIYNDEVVETQISNPSSTSDYKRIRKIVNNEMHEIKYNLQDEMLSLNTTEITEDNKTEIDLKTKGMYFNRCYGITETIFNSEEGFFGSNEYLGQAAKANYKLNITETGYHISSNFITEIYGTENYFSNDITLMVEDNVIISALLNVKSFDENPFKNDKFELVTDAIPSSNEKYEVNMTLGNRQNSPSPINTEQYFFTSFNASFDTNDYYVGETYQLNVTNKLPVTALESVDPIQVVNVQTLEGQDVISIRKTGDKNDLIRVNSKGKAKITIASKNHKEEITIDTKYHAVESIQINSSISINELVPGQKIELTAVISPNNTESSRANATIISGSENASLSVVDEMNNKYKLEVNDNATIGSQIVVEFTSISLGNDDTPVKQSISFTITKPIDGPNPIVERLVAGDWNASSGRTIVFNDDGTGLFTDPDEDLTISFDYSVEGETITVSNCVSTGFFDEVIEEIYFDGDSLMVVTDYYWSAFDFIDYNA